jgi:hypothetical protein
VIPPNSTFFNHSLTAEKKLLTAKKCRLTAKKRVLTAEKQLLTAERFQTEHISSLKHAKKFSQAAQ